MKLLTSPRRSKALALVCLITLLWGPAACFGGWQQPLGTDAADGSGSSGSGTSGNCQPIDQFFTQQMWDPLMSTVCVTCHQESSNPFLLTPGDPNASLTATEAVAMMNGPNNVSLLLLKPTGQDNHGGGMIFSTTSANYTIFSEFVAAVQSNAQCVTTSNP